MINNRNIGRGKRRKPTTEVINVNTVVSDDVKARAAESDVSLRVLAATSLQYQPDEAAGAGGADGLEVPVPPPPPPGLAGTKTEGMEEGEGGEDAAAGPETEEVGLQAIV